MASRVQNYIFSGLLCSGLFPSILFHPTPPRPVPVSSVGEVLTQSLSLSQALCSVAKPDCCSPAPVVHSGIKEAVCLAPSLCHGLCVGLRVSWASLHGLHPGSGPAFGSTRLGHCSGSAVRPNILQGALSLLRVESGCSQPLQPLRGPVSTSFLWPVPEGMGRCHWHCAVH